MYKDLETDKMALFEFSKYCIFHQEVISITKQSSFSLSISPDFKAPVFSDSKFEEKEEKKKNDKGTNVENGLVSWALNPEYGQCALLQSREFHLKLSQINKYIVCSWSNAV